jgi:hypothetical protein
MRDCLTCHRDSPGAQGRASAACTTCHVATASGRLKTTFDSGKLTPPRWLYNAGHGPGWIERHRLVAGQSSKFCASCHTDRECLDCHDGRVRPRHVHPNDWLRLHGVSAQQVSSRCTSCHRGQSFCLSCHQRAGVTLSGPYANLAERGRFHPPKSAWTDGPLGASHHGREARRRMSTCVSCHTERDCVLCHASGTRGGMGAGALRGGGIHPPGFASRCRSAYARNPRACLGCHTSRDASLEACR